MTPEFLSAEPLGNNVIAVTTQGAVDLSTVEVKLNNTVGLLFHQHFAYGYWNTIISRPWLSLALRHILPLILQHKLSRISLWRPHLLRVHSISRQEILRSLTLFPQPNTEGSSAPILGSELYWPVPTVLLLATAKTFLRSFTVSTSLERAPTSQISA